MSLQRRRLTETPGRKGLKDKDLDPLIAENYHNGTAVILTPSKTEQNHKDDVRMQKILKKHAQTGILNHVNKHQGTYMDMANAPTYQEAQNIIAHANSVFASLPATIREKMDNNPQTFVDFMQNPDNREAMEELGLDSSHLPQAPEEPPKKQKAAPAPEPTPQPETPPAD